MCICTPSIVARRTVFVKGADDMVLRLLAAGQEVQKTAQQVCEWGCEWDSENVFVASPP
jgi:hypothetical protein